MNRKHQLIEALNSCIDAKLPKSIEFVIVDNCSTDGTEDFVNQFKREHSDLEIKYSLQNTNLGVGGGRSLGFELSDGKYLYFLDDDAVISKESQKKFFIDTIDYLERNDNVASITTRIVDEVLNFDRDVTKSSKTIDGYNIIFKYLGGSHFLRKSSFTSPLYFNLKYGGEELAPSIQSQDNHFYHVYMDDVWIIHKPKVNKWQKNTESMNEILCLNVSVAYATKCVLYPLIFKPLLYLLFLLRYYKHLRGIKGSYKYIQAIIKEIKINNHVKKVKVITVLRLVKNFSISVL